MCGFLGEVCFKNTSKSNEKKFVELLTLSKYRGPDSSDIKQGVNYRFGFNRLAILDTTEKGNQPKRSKSKRYVFVFNGELYNYQDLIKKYKLDNLESSSDTEVLVHLFDLLGVSKTIKELNGMFAISIFDTTTNRLYLTRDFAGIKPFFYGVSPQGWVVASQFDQVFKHSFLKNKLQLRPEVVKEYFGFGYMQAPNTIYKNIFQVNPGELLILDEGKEIKKEVIKVFPKEVIILREKRNYTEVLKGCVKRQLISDVPIASFMSGGIDSPLITASAKELNSNIKAYTVGVSDKKFDESEKANIYGEQLGVDLVIQHISEKDVLENLEAHFKCIPEPFGDYSSLPTYLITKLAANDQTVMLSGDGGDELFLGYPRMLHIVKHRLFFKIPLGLRRVVLGVLRKLKLVSTHGPSSNNEIGDWVLDRQLKIRKNQLNAMFHKIAFTKEHSELYQLNKGYNLKSLKHWLRWNEFYAHMQRVLIKVDRASMGNSLEVRVPFLDKESIAYAWETNLGSFNSKKDLKRTLKESLAEFIPKDIIETKKKGFSVPLYNWLHNELKEEVHHLIFDTPFFGEEFMNLEEVHKFVREFYENKHKNEWGIWHIYAWQKWAVVHLGIK